MNNVLPRLFALVGLLLPALGHAAAGYIQFLPATISVNEGVGVAEVVIQRVNGSDGVASVRWAASGGTANVHTDYLAQTEVLIWEDGDAADKTIRFEVLDDQVSENQEYAILKLANPVNAQLGSYKTIAVWIEDNDTGPGRLEFREPSSQFNEGLGGGRVAVSRVAGSTGQVQVRWAANGGNAKGRVDYPIQTGLLTWADGEVGDKMIEFAINDDLERESLESVNLHLKSVAGSQLGRSSHWLTIIDDDADFSVNAGVGSCNLAPGRTVIEQWTSTVGTVAFGSALGANASSRQFRLPASCDIKEVSVEIAWAGNLEDLDMSLTKPDGSSVVAENGNTGGEGVEVIRLSTPLAGDYLVDTYGFTSNATQYRGTVTVDVGPVTVCESAFNGLPVGASMAAVDPNLDFDQPGVVILSFADASGREAGLQRLLAGTALDATERAAAYAFRNLHAIKLPLSLITPAKIESIRSAMEGLPLISIWGQSQDLPLINTSVPLIGVDAAREHFASSSLGLQGAGVGVAVIDTGIDKLQGDLKSVVHNVRMVGANAVEMENSETNEGHGTHIAGTIAGDGTQSGGRYVGIAPKADLVGVAVDVGAPYIFALDGIDYVLEQARRFNIRVSNHSYGPAIGSGFRFNPASADSLALKQMYDAGIIPVFAAGNAGPNNDTISANAQNPCVIAVANGDRNFQLASSSSRGTPDNTTAVGPDITAPGTRITAARAITGATSTTVPEPSNPYYATISGTSMAAPHVVGVIALMLEANPSLSFEQVHSIITGTATPMPGYAAHEVGAGYVDALGAIAAALGQAKPTGSAPIDVGAGATTVYEADGTSGLFLGVLCSGCPAEGNTTAPHKYDFYLPASLSDALEVRFRVDWASEVDHLNLSVFGPDDDSNLIGSSVTLGTNFQEVVATPIAPNAGVATGRYAIEIEESFIALSTPFSLSVDVIRPSGVSTTEYDREDFQSGGAAAPAQCADGIDNDGDGLTDFGSDPGCSSSIDDDETDPPPPSACSNDSDDDGDGWVDLDDPGCSSQSDNDESDAGTTECNNGLDDDGDGFIDEDDSGCASGHDTAEATAPPPTCPLGSGEQVLHSWTGTIGTAVAYSEVSGDTTHTESYTVSIPSGCAVTDLSVRISWDQLSDDLDLEVDAHGRTESAARTQLMAGEAMESVAYSSPEINGDYVIRTRGYVSVDVPFTGEVVATVVGGSSSNSNARVIVSVLDTGILPYHEYYYAGSPIYAASAPSAVTPAVLADLGIDAAHQIELTRTGNFAADYAADAAIWSNIQRGELYWFKGTNIIAASFDTAAGRRPILPDPGDPSGEHGVGTSASVLQANPEAIVLFVEFGSSIGDATAEDLGFLLDEVDIISTSYGYADPVLATIGLPIPFTGPAAEAVIEKGKLHFSSAANSPDPTTPEAGGSGPWWTIAIAGIEEGSSEGRTTVSGYFTDFVSDFTQQLPYCFECESGIDDSVSGTSFATPRSAGVASKVLLEARRALGHVGGITQVGSEWVMAAGNGQTISNWQIRRALEVGAYVDSALDYDPIEAIFDLGSQPVVDVAPWATVGWGNLSALPSKAVVEETLAQLGLGSGTRTKAAEFCDFQTANIRRRKTYWDAPGPGWFFNSYDTPSTDPFIYCGSLIP